MAMSSSWVPCSTTFPLSMRTIWLAFRMVESRCATTKLVRPFSIRSMPLWMAASESESRELVASSMIMMAGSAQMARAMLMRCFCPTERATPSSPIRVSYPRGSPWMKSWISAAFAAATTSSSVAAGRP